MTAAEFRLYHPAFNTASDALIDVKLAVAELSVGDTWGLKRDFIVALSAAADLANSPEGRNARLDKVKKRNLYAEQLAREQESHACLFNRIG